MEKHPIKSNQFTDLQDFICDFTRNFIRDCIGIELEKHNEIFHDYWKEWKEQETLGEEH